MMQMVGLRDVTLTAQDERGIMTAIQIQKDKPVTVPDAFATTAKSLGYAKPIEEAEQDDA